MKITNEFTQFFFLNAYNRLGHFWSLLSVTADKFSRPSVYKSSCLSNPKGLTREGRKSKRRDNEETLTDTYLFTHSSGIGTIKWL